MSALVGSWSAIVLRGVVAIVFGVFALLLPGLTVGVVIAVFAVFTIVYGLIALVSAILARRNDQPWLGELLTGAVAIAAAVVVMIWPDLTAAGLLVVIAIFAVVLGIAERAPSHWRGSSASTRSSSARHWWGSASCYAA